MVESRQRPDLPAETLAVSLGQVRAQHLERDGALQVGVTRLEDMRHAADTQRPDDLVTVVEDLARLEHSAGETQAPSRALSISGSSEPSSTARLSISIPRRTTSDFETRRSGLDSW